MMHLLRLASRRLALVASVVTGLISSAHADPMSDISTGIWKMKYGVTNAQIADPNWLNADSDGDGVKNKDEIAAGTNPFSAGSVAKITGITAGASTVDITFPTELRKYYVVQGTSSLTAGFTSTASVWLGTGVPKTLTVTKGTNKFFRVLVQDIDSDGDGASDWAETVAGYNPNNGADGGVTVLTNALASSDVVTVTVTNSSATQPLAGFAPVETGSITVSRGGPLKFHALTVNVQKSGTAIAGTDYDDPLPTLQSVTFPINVGEVVLPIKPMANSSRKTNVTAIVKALPGTNYTLGGKSSGSVVINPAGTANGTGLTGQYHNSSNSVYGPVAGAGNDQLDIFAGAAEMTRVDSTIDFNGIASITTGNPCTVTTVYSHGLTSGTPVVISGVTGGTFSVAINGTFAATVTGANTFTVASSCTVIPTSLQVASVCGLNVITAVSTTGNPCILTTKVPHGLTTGNAVAINWLNGGTFGSSVNATHIATVTGASTFTIPISCTASPSAAQLAVATLSGPSGVNGWGSTKGPTGMASPATGGAWSVRWTGQVLPQYSETYTFDVRSNGSSKLWINGQLLVDRWATSVTVGEYTNTITLKAGTLYDIQIDYWMSAPIAGSTGNAEARLFWWSPSQTKQIIPQSRLFPAPASVADKFTAITSSSSATGYEGVPFSFFVTSPDIGATITYALAPDSGTLPNGLSLNVNTGEILGIPTASPQTRGTYNVAINATNVAAGTPTGSSIVDITIYPVGAVTREVLTATGPKVADIAIPSPAVTPVHDTISTVDDDTEYPNNTGERLRGYIVPPETGNYYFWIAANNAAELWISNDSEYVNRVKRASLTADSGQKVWNNAPTQQSGWMALVAGQKYYFEVLHNTGANVIDDYVSMGWCQDDIGTVPSTSTAPNPTGAATLIPNGGAPLQGYPLSGTVPGYIFQPYDYPVVTPPTGTLYASNLGPQTNAITSASGSANIQVNAAETQAILHFTYQNLGTPKTSYHLHVDTFTGDDLAVHPQGEIIFDIDDADQNPSEQTGDGGYIWTFSPVGTFTSAAQLREALHKGKVYLNIHSVGYPSGEIRGTLGLIDGSQTPPDASLYPEPAYTDIATNGAHAARFLNQATFGANPDDVAAVQATGFSSWINAQLALAPSRVSNEVVAGITSNINDLYPSSLFTNAWWKSAITAPDQLRQRLAFALSEIMVISWANDSGPLQRNGRILADYYDNLVDYCLPTAGVTNSGNFRGILKAVTLTPAMGLYLDMRGNQKGDDTIGRHPNENYGREIMQLFSVGIYRMWDDGRFVLGSDAGLVPTYSQPNIIGLASLLTGWNYAQPNQSNGRAPTNFGPSSDFLNPMVLVPTAHELASKLLLNNVMSPAATGRTPRVNISSISPGVPNTGPCTVNTSTIHGLKTGDTVTLAGVTSGTFAGGSTAINAAFQATVTSPTSFTVPVSCTAAAGTAGTVTGATITPAGISGTAGITAVTGSQADNSGTGANHPYDLYGQAELDRAIDNIVNNDNVPPYICRQLIQRLVTSDPSPGYVYRVVQKWKDNGSGVRGDLAAVVSQILLDGEARRSSVTQSSTTFGKQREPMLRLTGTARAFSAANYTGSYTQLTGVDSNKFRIVTSTPNDFSSGFTVSLNFRGNYFPLGQTLLPNNLVPTSTNYAVNTTLGIASTTTDISAIDVANPARVHTVTPHGLSTGNAVIINSVTGGTFSAALTTQRTITVIDATTFDVVGVNCTVLPTSVASAKMISNPCKITTVQNHGLTTGDSVTISGTTGTFSPIISGSTFTVTVVDPTSFTVASNCTVASAVNTGSLVGANTLDVTATGMSNATYTQSAGSNILTVNTGGPQTNVVVPGTTVNIASIALGNPCTVTTSAPHNLVSGGVVTIAGAGGDGVFATAINGTFVPTSINSTQFTVPVDCTQAPTAAVGTTTRLTRSKVYLAFLTQTTAGGAAIPADSITNVGTEVLTTNGTSSFTIATTDTPLTARGGNVLLPKFTTSYTPSGTNINYNNNVNHNMSVGNRFWVDVPVVGNPVTDAEYAVTVVTDEDHLTTSRTPIVTNGGTYPNPSGSNNGVTVYPLVPPPLGRSGSVVINQSTFNLGSTESTLTQSPLNAPTVFNYFFPDYKFPGTLANSGLDSPEFQLTTDTNVMNLTNSLTNMIIGTGGGNGNLNGLTSFNNGTGTVVLDIGRYMEITDDLSNGAIPGVVDQIADLLVGAPLEAATRTTIVNFVANNTNFPYTTPTPLQKRDRVRAIIHLIITSAEYAVQK